MSFFSDLDKIWSQGSKPPPKQPGGSGRRGWEKRWLIISGGVILFFIALSIWRGIYTEWLWFGSLGFSSVYTTILTTRVWLFFAGALIFLALLMPNLFLARRLSPISGDTVFIGQGLVVVRRVLDIGILGVVIFLGIIFGMVASSQWETILRFSHAANFGVSEPLLGRDVAFYVFNLPFYHFLQGWLMWAVVITLIFTAVIYGLNLGFRRSAFTTAIKGHLSVLGAVIFFLIGWSYWLNIFDLVFSDRGVIFGAGFTDVHAQWLAWKIIVVISVICGLLLLVSIFRPWRHWLLTSIGLWIVSVIIFGSIYPAIIQRFQVEPSELARERPYIERNIQATRLAFGLDKIEVRDIPVELALRGQLTTDNNVYVGKFPGKSQLADKRI